jgi:hypothetical protein
MILNLAPNAAGVWSLASPLAQFDFPTEFGDNLALAAVIVGFVMGPVIDAINRRDWPSEAKAIAAFVQCCAAAALLAWAMGQLEGVRAFTFDMWIRTVMIVFVVAIALHRFYWKPSGISDAIDRATG